MLTQRQIEASAEAAFIASWKSTSYPWPTWEDARKDAAFANAWRYMCQAALEAAESAAWQDISTATKDIEVYVYSADQGMMEATYFENDSWLNYEGLEIVAPTHWRPLPPAPKAEA